MKARLKQALMLAGLREDEIHLYLLLLKYKNATVSKLLEHSNLPAIRVYRMIHSLESRGLVKANPINRKERSFYPLSLKNILDQINKKRRDLKNLELTLQSMDPFLAVISDNGEQDGIEIRQGLPAFREEYLKMPDSCADEYLHIGSMENFWETAGMTYDGSDERQFIHKRMKNGVYARVLDFETESMLRVKNNDYFEKRTVKFIPPDMAGSQNYLAIGEKHASFFVCDLENPRVFIIKQPDLLAFHKEQFGLLWEKCY